MGKITYGMKRILSLLLAAVMLLGAVPTQALAADPIRLAEGEIPEEVVQSGDFYLAAATAELSEAEPEAYLLRVARGGDGQQAATLRLQLVDVTANYGKDYKVTLPGSGLFGAKVENADTSSSLMDEMIKEGVQEDLQGDLALAGMSQEQIEAALQEQVDGFGETLGSELSAYAEEHPDRYVSAAPETEQAPQAEAPADAEPAGTPTEPETEAPAAEEPEVEATVVEDPQAVPLNEREGDKEQESEPAQSLSQLFEQQTGLQDDWKALSSDGSSVLDTASLLMDYSMDAADAIGEGLNSAYLDIPFAEGQTERFVSIRTLDNSQGEGDRIFMARLTAQTENAHVNGEFGRCMFTITDDEQWEKPTVFFAADRFEAKDGFVDVTICRQGVLTSVISVHLMTLDGAALNGRDYSQVDADVTFPFGVSERTIHIPVRSDWLSARSEFDLALSDPKSCRIGETATAVGVIEADSKSFVMTKAETQEPETEAQSPQAELQVYSGGIRYGEEVDLSKWSEAKVSSGNGSFWVEGSQLKIKANSDDFFSSRVWTYVEYDLRRDIKRDGNVGWLTGYGASGIEYTGVAIQSNRNDSGDPRSDATLYYTTDFYTSPGSAPIYNKEFDLGSDGGSWDSTEHRFYNDDVNRIKQGISYVRIWNSHDGGCWRKQNTLTVESVRPILRPFLVTAEIDNPDALRYADNQGNLVSYKAHDSVSSAGELVIGGANTGENTVLKYVGDYIEVSCEGKYSYIKQIEIKDPKYGGTYVLTPTYSVGNKTASFALDTSCLAYLHRRNLITFAKNPDGDGYVGKLALRVVMGKIPTALTLNNSDARGSVTMGFGVHSGAPGSNWRSGDDRNYYTVYRGDYVCFKEQLKTAYQDSFNASTIYVKRERQSNSDEAGFSNAAYELFDKNQSEWKVTMFNDYSALTAKPAFDDVDNHIVVRVKNEDKALFDTDSGIFTAAAIPGPDGCTDYEVVTRADFEAHKFYTLAASVKDADSVAVWTPGSSSVSYSQSSYYHEATSEKGANVIELTCRKADALPYAVTGEAYYAALDLYTGVEGETWMPADGFTVMVSPSAYAISDATGKFTTVPFKGVAGCRVMMRTESLGTVNYRYVTLNKGIIKTVGTGDSSVTAYMAPLGTFVVPVVNPKAASVNAASLTDEMGVAVKTAPVYADVLTSQQHRYTFTATVVHDGSEYLDTDGTPRTEHVKSVEFVAYDAKENTPRGELPGVVTEIDNGHGSKTYSLTLGLNMSEDNLNIYRPGDKIYVRMTTDKVKGNGVSVDENGNVLVDEQGRVWQIDDHGERVPVLDVHGEQAINTALLETVYAPVYTGYNLVSAANFTPPELNINVVDTDMDSLFDRLPVFGSLNSTLRLSKLSVSEQALPNGGISLCIGYRLNTDNDYKNLEYDEGYSGIGDAAKKMMEFGKSVKSPPPMTVGVGHAGVNPFVGLYLDFGIKDSDASKSLQFIGGGLYVGCVGFFKVVMYFPVGPIPVYFGVEGDLTGYVNLGFQIPKNAMTVADIAANGVDDLIDPDFKLKVQATMRLYVGVGLAGVLGVRGGLNFFMSYIYYPSVTNIKPDYHQHGFTIDLSLRIWVDAFIFSIPIPALNLVKKNYGYAKDLENETAKLQSAEESGPMVRRTAQPTGWLPGDPELQATMTESAVTTLIGENYPYADPQLLDTGRELICVFLTTESFFGTPVKGRGDESTLAYSIYPYMQEDPQWTAPMRLGDADTMATGDFQPNVIICLDKERDSNLLISWVSRQNVPWAADPEQPTTEERLDYLRQMEIYTAHCDLENGSMTVNSYQRVTSDEFYNYQPQAIFEMIGLEEKTMLFYQTADPAVQEISWDDPVYTDFQNEESRQLLANVSPGQNAGFQMSKQYDQLTGSWKGDDLAGTFVVTPVGGQNHPAITDFAAREYAFPTKAGDDVKQWVMFSYTLDGDGDLSTPYDKQLYLQLYDAETDEFCQPILLSGEQGVSVSRPQFTETRRYNCYLLWYETVDTTLEKFANRRKNGEVKVLDIRELFLNGIDEETGTMKSTVDIDELRSRYGSEYEALENKEGIVDYAYAPPIQTVDMPDCAEFEDGPSVGSFMPYLDNMTNLYVIWLQSMLNDEVLPDGTVRKVQTNEIYASARVEDTDAENRWSMPVRLTNDLMFYDEATLVNLFNQDKLIVAANRYEFALQPDGGSGARPVESADFVMVEFTQIGSVEADSISFEREMPAAGEAVEVSVKLRNKGLLPAYGGGYIIRDLIDGQTGGFTKSGTVGELLPGDTEEVTFTYVMPDDLDGVESIGFVVESQEDGYENVSTVRFEDEDALRVGWRAELGELSTQRRSDGFYVNYTVMNSGSVTMPAGAVQAMAGDTSAMETVWAAQTVQRALAPGETAEHTVKLSNVRDDFATGFQRGFITLADAEGKALDGVGSSRDLILSLDAPYGVVVNGRPELASEGISIAAGDTLELSGSYQGVSRYPDGEVQFTTLNSGVAVAYEGLLYAAEPGETVLVAKVGRYGGTATIPLTVTPKTTIAGDIDGDGKVNAKDVVALQRRLAGGYGVTVDEAWADVNHDGKVNAKDIVLLQRFVAGGYGVTLD